MNLRMCPSSLAQYDLNFSSPGNLAFLILYSHRIPELLGQLLSPNSLKWEIIIIRDNYQCDIRVATPSSSARILSLCLCCRKTLIELGQSEMLMRNELWALCLISLGWARTGILRQTKCGKPFSLLSVDTECSLRWFLTDHSVLRII